MSVAGTYQSWEIPMKLTPKASAVLEFIETLLRAGCPASDAAIATKAFLNTVRISKRDQKAIDDVLLTQLLAQMFCTLGIFRRTA
jgi:hypothetical protein